MEKGIMTIYSRCDFVKSEIDLFLVNDQFVQGTHIAVSPVRWKQEYAFLLLTESLGNRMLHRIKDLNVIYQAVLKKNMLKRYKKQCHPQ